MKMCLAKKKEKKRKNDNDFEQNICFVPQNKAKSCKIQTEVEKI